MQVWNRLAIYRNQIGLEIRHFLQIWYWFWEHNICNRQYLILKSPQYKNGVLQNANWSLIIDFRLTKLHHVNRKYTMSGLLASYAYGIIKNTVLLSGNKPFLSRIKMCQCKSLLEMLLECVLHRHLYLNSNFIHGNSEMIKASLSKQDLNDHKGNCGVSFSFSKPELHGMIDFIVYLTIDNMYGWRSSNEPNSWHECLRKSHRHSLQGWSCWRADSLWRMY